MHLATSEISWRPAKTMLCMGQVQDPLSPLRLPLQIPNFCIQPEKTIILGICSSGRTTGIAPLPLYHPGRSKTMLPDTALAGAWGSPHLTALFWAGEEWGMQLRPGKGTPQEAPCPIQPSSLRPQPYSAISVLERCVPALPAASQEHQAPESPANKAVIALATTWVGL